MYRSTHKRYGLGPNVENLSFIGTGAFTGVGNTLANTITGGAGADTLRGGAGNDTYGSGADAYCYVYADTNGDKAADLLILVDNLTLMIQGEFSL